MLLILVYSFTLNVLLAVAENAKLTLSRNIEIKNLRLPTSHLSTGKDKTAYNLSTYIDRTENVLRIPDMRKNFEEHKAKKKNSKKSPKRTIQKIIKKNKSRRKLYMNQATSTTKLPMKGDDIDQFYAQEEMSQRNENYTTIQVNQKKKKKWPASRYPMPFHHTTFKKDSYRRNKRSEDREDVFILTDLDEVKFLEEGKDENVVNAHIKRYW